MRVPQQSTPPHWSGATRRALGATRVAAPLLGAVAAGLFALFAIVARHGLDLTDEGFYLLNFRHWHSVPAFTLFGAYFQIPYRLFGESLWAMRMLGMILLIGTGTWCAFQLMLIRDVLMSQQGSAWIAPASIAAGLTALNYYGGFVVPYTPSYNTLALISALLCTALTMQVGRAFVLKGSIPGTAAFALGLAISMGVANKFSAGTLVALFDGVIAAAIVWRRVPVRQVALTAALVVTGFLLNALVLVLIDPQILIRLNQGIVIQLALLPRNITAEYARFLSEELPNGVHMAARMLLWPVLFSTAVLVGGRFIGRPAGAASSAIVAFLTLALYVGFIRHRAFRIEFVSMVALVLWVAWAARRIALGERPWSARTLVVDGAMLAMPFAYSFGTNNVMLQHMGMAAVFPSLLIASSLRSFRREGLLHEWAFIGSLALLAATPSEVFVRQWLNGEHTYRLGAALGDQNVKLPPNPARVESLVDQRMARTVDRFLELTRAAGMKPGAALFDLTGQAPGLVVLAGATPIGAAWIAGGGSFRGDAAARLAVSLLDASELRRAWLMTSEDSFARVPSWREVVQAKLGSFPYEEAGRMTLPDPSSPDKTVRITISLWKPLL